MKTFDHVEDEVMGNVLKVIEGDKIWWVMPDSNSGRWLEYLRYTAWVEAGNSPEDFWVSEGNTAEVIEEP